MYNRYVRNDNGVYRRIPEAQEGAEQRHRVRERMEGPGSALPGQSSASPGGFPGKDGLFSGILGKLKLDEIDTGDLLLLVMLFLLFRDGEDEELLIALGLLLIL